MDSDPTLPLDLARAATRHPLFQSILAFHHVHGTPLDRLLFEILKGMVDQREHQREQEARYEADRCPSCRCYYGAEHEPGCSWTAKQRHMGIIQGPLRFAEVVDTPHVVSPHP